MRLHVEDTFDNTLTIIVSGISSKGEFLQNLWERSKELAFNELEIGWENYYSTYEEAIEAQTESQYEAFLDTMIIQEFDDLNDFVFEIEAEIYKGDIFEILKEIDKEENDLYSGYFIQPLWTYFDDIVTDYDDYYFDKNFLYCLRSI